MKRAKLIQNLFVGTFLTCFLGVQIASAVPPRFDDNYAEKLINTEGVADSEGRVEGMYARNVDKEKTFMENIKALFYPQANGDGGQIRELLRYIGYGLLVIMFVYAGRSFIADAGEADKAKQTVQSILYIIIGAIVFFASTWILGTALDFGSGSEQLVETVEKNLLFQLLSFLKAAAFFLAVIMVIWYGYQMLSTVEKEDRINIAKGGILNVIVALVFIKIIDYIYFIAQASDFKNKATDLIVQISKVLAFVLGAAFTLALIFAGIRLMTDGGGGKGFETFKKVVMGIFFGALVIFLFLLISYQVVQEFAG